MRRRGRTRGRLDRCGWRARSLVEAARVAGAVALLALVAACSDSAPPGDGDAAGAGAAIPLDEAPRFDLPRLGGGRIDSASLAGKIVIVDFWATWCPPCEEQVPALNEFHRAHRDDGDVVVLGISVDTVGPDEVAEWVKAKDVEYPILLDGMPVAQDLGAPGFPTLLVVTPDGRIDSQHVGWIEVGMLRAILEDALQRLRATSAPS